MGEHLTQHGVHGTTRALLTHMMANQNLVLRHATHANTEAQEQVRSILAMYEWRTDVLMNADGKAIDLSGEELVPTGVVGEYEDGLEIAGSDPVRYSGYSYASGFDGTIVEARRVMKLLANRPDNGDITTLTQLMGAWERAHASVVDANAALAASAASMPSTYNHTQ